MDPEQIFLELVNFAKYVIVNIIPVVTICLKTKTISNSKWWMGVL